MNWQAAHERIQAEMNKVAGEPVKDLKDTLTRITDPEKRKRLAELNKSNNYAITMWRKEQAKRNRKEE